MIPRHNIKIPDRYLLFILVITILLLQLYTFSDTHSAHCVQYIDTSAVPGGSFNDCWVWVHTGPYAALYNFFTAIQLDLIGVLIIIISLSTLIISQISKFRRRKNKQK